MMYTWLFLIEEVCATRNRDVYFVIKPNQRTEKLCSRLTKAKGYWNTGTVYLLAVTQLGNCILGRTLSRYL
jgi:hypothetical protein